MIIGLSTYHSDRDFLDSLARAGIDCVELSLPGREYAGFDYAGFAENAKGAGLDIRSFHLPFYLAPEDGPVDPASLDPDVRRRSRFGDNFQSRKISPKLKKAAFGIFFGSSCMTVGGV